MKQSNSFQMLLFFSHPFLSPLGRWECPWHQCDICGEEAASFCEMCPSSYCSKHREGLLFISRLDGKLCCSEHDPCGPEPLEPGEIREYMPNPRGLTPGLTPGLTTSQTSGQASSLTPGRSSGLKPGLSQGLTPGLRSGLGMAVIPSGSSHSAAAAVSHSSKGVREKSAPSESLPTFSIPVPISIPVTLRPAATSSSAAAPPPVSSHTPSSPHIFDLPHYSPISSYDDEEEDLLGDVEDEEEEKSHPQEEDSEEYLDGEYEEDQEDEEE